LNQAQQISGTSKCCWLIC